VQLSKENISKLFDLANTSSQSFDISLVSKELRVGSDLSISFDVDDNLLDRIIYNLDDVDITMKDKASIEIFESNHRNQRPWIFK
jgi:3-isopropylmalate/(R)-2-methylmalate dehydratase small subunit